MSSSMGEREDPAPPTRVTNPSGLAAKKLGDLCAGGSCEVRHKGVDVLLHFGVRVTHERVVDNQSNGHVRLLEDTSRKRVRGHLVGAQLDRAPVPLPVGMRDRQTNRPIVLGENPGVGPGTRSRKRLGNGVDGHRLRLGKHGTLSLEGKLCDPHSYLVLCVPRVIPMAALMAICRSVS